MKKNRRVSKKMSVVASTAMRFGAILLFSCVMVILNVLSSSSCAQLLNERGAKERELAKLGEAFRRASTRWDEMKTPEKIESALFRHGLRMSVPRADQYVRVNANGVPYPNQVALSRLRKSSSVMVVPTAPLKRSQPSRSRTRRD